MIETPFEQIKKSLSSYIPSNAIQSLPDRWEKIGDVIIVKLPTELRKYREKIGEQYGKILQC